MVSEAIHCHSGRILAGAVGSYLGWLGALDGEKDGDLYDLVAAGLANQVLGSADRLFMNSNAPYLYVEATRSW